MPNLDSVPVREYQPLDPYHHVVDNQPIKDLETQISLVNNEVENFSAIITEAIGTQGTMANRMAQSIEEDGSLKTQAIDDATHSIAAHTDDDGYVRMTEDERDKLSGVASGATNLAIQVEAISSTPLYDSGEIAFKPSDSVEWRVDGTDIYADVTFPMTARHQHYYDIKAVPLVPSLPDYINYTVNSLATPYKEGSLRVFVNGVRISRTSVDDEVVVPRGSGSETTWFSLSYEEDTATDGVVDSGKFALSAAITSDDRIYTDFDVALT